MVINYKQDRELQYKKEINICNMYKELHITVKY